MALKAAATMELIYTSIIYPGSGGAASLHFHPTAGPSAVSAPCHDKLLSTLEKENRANNLTVQRNLNLARKLRAFDLKP
jgi:hypothetical protein